MVDAPRAVSSEASPTRPLCAVSRPWSPAAAVPSWSVFERRTVTRIAPAVVAGATSRHSSAAGGDGGRFAAPARDAGAVGGGEDGGEAVGAQGRGLPPAPVGAVAPEAGQHAVGLGSADGGPGQCGPEGDGGDPERGRGRRAALLEQPAEVGGQRGIGRRRGAAPGVELTQRAAIGRAGVGAQGVRGEAPGGRGGRGERPGRGAGGSLGEGVRGPDVIRIMPHNGTYR